MPDRPSPEQLDAFARWFDQWSPALRLYARQWHDTATADEIVQEAFVALLGQQTTPTDAHAWLFRVVRNQAIDRLRRGSRRRQREIDAGGARQPWFESRIDDLIDAQQATQLLQDLPGDQREIVVLRIWGDLSFTQIADTLAAPRTTVFRRYQDALSTMRQRMETPCPTDPKND